MEKELAIQLANKVAPHFPGCKEFFVTDDEQVFTRATDAVENAVKLCSGNPQVITLSVDELEFEALPNEALLTEEEMAADAKIKAIKTAQEKVDALKLEIKKWHTDADIDHENTAQKLHVANLHEQLKIANAELKSLKSE